MDSIDDIAARLRVVIRLVYRRVQTETGEGSPTRSEQAAMSWLDERGSMTLGALAALEQVRQQSMSQSVDALEQRGWAQRAPDPNDRRQVIVSLTENGREALEIGRSVRQAWIVDAMTRLLSEDERRALSQSLDLLERIARAERE
ncbi:MAG TPA: MarR family transcriptional regulator [Roseiarcus sp.]|nr:MarR family transcriptional regulator [Roseiarcus sp.]